MPERIAACCFVADTEGSFLIERVVDVASAAVRHITSVAQRSRAPDQLEVAKGFTVEGILEGISYFRVQDHVEQVALVNLLGDLLRAQPQVGWEYGLGMQ